MVSPEWASEKDRLGETKLFSIFMRQYLENNLTEICPKLLLMTKLLLIGTKVEWSMSLDDLELLQVFVGIPCYFTDLGGSKPQVCNKTQCQTNEHMPVLSATEL